MPPNAIAEYSASLAPALLACFLVILTHAGFALFETGMCRAKNAAHTMSMSFLVYALGIFGFFVTGFALMCGGTATFGELNHWLIHFGNWGILGGKGFFLSGQNKNGVALFWFVFMMARINIATTIPTGALAERWNFKSFFLFSILASAVLCPIYGCWVWGGGWISQLGTQLGWGHGGVDYAGSSVIHMQGGVIALVTAWMIGPRFGKYDLRHRPRPILGHHVPMAMLGSLILAVAWLALDTGTSMAAGDGRVAVVAVNTALSSAGGALAAALYMASVYGKSDPSMMCNGMLAGLVAIAAPCAFVQPLAALFIGLVAGVLVIWSVFFWERRGIDDPIGVISVHGVNGLWGLLALGLFGDGTYGQTFNHAVASSSGVAGLFYGDGKQFLCQCLMAGVCLAWNLIAGGVMFALVGRLVGGNRVSPQTEMSGLDVPQVGVPAYPEFFNPVPSATMAAPEPRPATSPSAGGQKRFSIVVEGVDPKSLISAWSNLCQTSSHPPAPEFKAIYPYVTTVTGNRFRFSGGDPAVIKDNLGKLFQAVLENKVLTVRIES